MSRQSETFMPIFADQIPATCRDVLCVVMNIRLDTFGAPRGAAIPEAHARQ